MLLASAAYSLHQRFLAVERAGAVYCGDNILRVERPFEFVTDFRGFRFRGSGNDIMDRIILACGDWEPAILNLIETILRSERASLAAGKSLISFDVGAHRGTHSLVYSSLSDQVYSFEPNPPIYQDLQENLALNAITNVEALKLGLSDSDGSAEFFVPPGTHTGIGGFNASFSAVLPEEQQQKIQVPIKRGDSFVSERGLETVSFIKIDVEGFERAVLAGLKTTIAEFQPVVIVEYSPGVRDGFASVKQLIEQFPESYKFKRVSANNSQYVLDDVPQPVREQTTILAYPERKASLVPANNPGS